jgi:hypothetical protein
LSKVSSSKSINLRTTGPSPLRRNGAGSMAKDRNRSGAEPVIHAVVKSQTEICCSAVGSPRSIAS